MANSADEVKNSKSASVPLSDIQGTKFALYTGEKDDICEQKDSAWLEKLLSDDNKIIDNKVLPGRDHNLLHGDISYFDDVLKSMSKNKPKKKNEHPVVISPPTKPKKATAPKKEKKHKKDAWWVHFTDNLAELGE